MQQTTFTSQNHMELQCIIRKSLGSQDDFQVELPYLESEV